MDIAVFQRVVGGKDGAAGITENSCHPLLLQTFPKYLRACLHHKIFHPIEDTAIVPKRQRPIRNSGELHASLKAFSLKLEPGPEPETCPDRPIPWPPRAFRPAL